MIDFKREHTQFTGGETLDGRELMEQPVRIWKRAPTPSYVKEEDDTEDYWHVVTYADGKTHIVEGCDLTPHPEAPPTNVEFITHLMENSHHGPVMQMFIIDALGKWADIVIDMSDEDKAKFGGFINPALWIATAKEAREALDAKYGPDKRQEAA